jgi:hypothetical protein
MILVARARGKMYAERLTRLAQPKKREDRQHNDDETNEIDDIIHERSPDAVRQSLIAQTFQQVFAFA